MNGRRFNFFENVPVVTKNLIIINVLFWLATSLFSSRVDLTSWLGLHYPTSGDFRFFQFISYMFMHASFPHIFFNMFAVYMFGRIIELEWGQKRFLTYYLITGVGAGVINLIVAYIRIKLVETHLDPDMITFYYNTVYSEGLHTLKQGKNYIEPPLLGQLNQLINAPMVGASGAVFGILLAFGMMFPNMPLYIIPFPFPIKAKYLVMGYGVIELFAGFANFSFDHIAHFAHLGGMLFGLILILYWKKKNKDNGRYLN